jgi:hypothetical protein
MIIAEILALVGTFPARMDARVTGGRLRDSRKR